MEWIHTNTETLLVRKIPGNGNCLFAAIINQIHNDNPSSFEHQWRVRTLRRKLTDYIRRNINVYKETILQNVQEENDRTCHTTSLYQIETYLKNLATDGFWGGEETIAAFAEMERKCIRIFQEGGNTIVYREVYRNNGVINLAYRMAAASGNERNHYDSVIDVISTRTARYQIDYRQERAAWEQKINAYEIDEADESTQEKGDGPPTMDKQGNSIKIATWNIRGCSKPDKRSQINDALHKENIDIACLQETKMRTGDTVTRNYNWHHSGKKDGTTTNRGVAILIRLNSKINLLGFKENSESICEGILQTSETIIRVITVHIPSDSRMHKTFEELTTTIAKGTLENLILIGDFNAHIGRRDITKKEKHSIGPRLQHESSNENGRELLNLIQLHNLILNSSWAKSKTILTTWTNGKTESQLDHILTSESTHRTITVNYIQASWKKEVSTDHKLVKATIQLNKNQNNKNTNSAARLQNGKRTANNENLKWNLKRLKNEKEKEEYTLKLEELLRNIPDREKHNTTTFNNCITDKIREAAATTLHRPSSPKPQALKDALKRRQKALNRKMENPQNQQNRQELRDATADKNRAYKEHEAAKCANFFQNINDYNPAQRLHNTYKFLKHHRRTAEIRNRTFIPIKHWEDELLANNGNEAQMVEETSYWPLNPPPTIRELANYCNTMKNAKAPGTDRINTELVKEGPQELADNLEELMALTWRTNRIPEAWMETLQIPIPKIKHPKSTDDYRRITLCNTFYKIYTKHIAKVLEDILGDLPFYQAAFTKNRSTEDHIYTTRRVLEEKWRRGRKVYVLSLDLAKAFDSVDISVIPIILKHSGVPGWLTNRIVATCLRERTSILWFGQKTESRKKTKGVKQGCPLSPRLFNLVLHEVMITLEEIIPNLTLGITNEKTPCVLAFADDIIIMAENEKDLDNILNELPNLLLSVGLAINYTKTAILVRDPIEPQQINPSGTIRIGNHQINLVKKCKYLGTFLTDALDRPETVTQRIKKAHQATRIITPFILQHKIPWTTTKIIYKSVILPMVMYGLQATVTTKANRTRLKHMERKIVQFLKTHSRESTENEDDRTCQILEKKTILKTLQIRRLRYWGHIQRRKPDHILQKARHFQVRGARKIGRPCYTWNDTLAEDMKKTGKTENWWIQAAENKQTMKQLTSEIYHRKMRSDSEESDEEEGEEEEDE